MMFPATIPLERRRVLALFGAAGATALRAGDTETGTAASCIVPAPPLSEEAFWVDEKLLRSDIRTDPTTGEGRPGIRLTLTINLRNLTVLTCLPLTGATVDIWHCDARGLYSDQPAYDPGGGTGTVATTGQKFLRGYQISDDNGQVVFTTVYPGWYTGRTVHINVRVRTYANASSPNQPSLDEFVTQIFFPDNDSNVVLAQAPYNARQSARDTINQSDSVYTSTPNTAALLSVTGHTIAGYIADITLGLSLRTAPGVAPAILSGGIVNAASGAAAFTSGSWISLYGTNLAASVRSLANSDVVARRLPTSLGGVSVRVNGNAAFLLYVSPTQINALAPADTTTGSVPVTVTNANGTSIAAPAIQQTIFPGLFALLGYVRAVRVSDGAILDGTFPVNAGDVLEIYGTGFGPVTSPVETGTVFQGAYPTQNVVGASIGGLSAHVSFAGLVAAGLYQINLTVPAGLAPGDHPVVATTGGISTQTAALLKTS